ncbi:MAG: hypothetical protein J7524_18885 [Roseofilum sp. Belize BBD 4]|uniref:hypothetical protein n=1 Tax=Roseofilum sp. Belize BBD 4 TaxID=2821500 RepID=UPI001B2BE526|nr:hypothetical protein [Roseofilum sp. Belize BBD 4]MBP0035212.1 hypothetical protein [Roseofilum sp. Belize BBD 4]
MSYFCFYILGYCRGFVLILADIWGRSPLGANAILPLVGGAERDRERSPFRDGFILKGESMKR